MPLGGSIGFAVGVRGRMKIFIPGGFRRRMREEKGDIEDKIGGRAVHICRRSVATWHYKMC